MAEFNDYSKHEKEKASPKRKCYFLRSAITKQAESTTFQLPEKIKIIENMDISQNSVSVQETKCAESSSDGFQSAKECIISPDSSVKCEVNQESSDLNFVRNSNEASDEECKKVKNIENQNTVELNDLKLLETDSHLKSDPSHEGLMLIKNRSFNAYKRKLRDTFEVEAMVSKNIVPENGKENPEFLEHEFEKKEPSFQTKKKTNKHIKRTHKVDKIEDQLKDDFKETSSEGCKESKQSSPEIQTDDNKAIKLLTLDIEEKPKEQDTNKMLSEKVNTWIDLLDTNAEEKDFSSYFDIKIPILGKNVFQNDEKPFTERYDLAIERNKRRFQFMKKAGIDYEISRTMKRGVISSETHKKETTMLRQSKNINMACYITELCLKILNELSSDKIKEWKVMYNLVKFLQAPITLTCLLYVPHLVHTISFIKCNKAFSKMLRLVAKDCYDKCHAMFPVPLGFNFETVYTSEMRKFLPDDFEKFENDPFDYGDAFDILESSDYNDASIKLKNPECQ